MTSITTLFLPLLAWLHWPLRMSQEIALGGAAAITLCGMWLCWGTAQYRMWVEERIKDGKLSGDVGRRKITQRNLLGPSVTILGMALLLYAVVG